MGALPIIVFGLRIVALGLGLASGNLVFRLITLGRIWGGIANWILMAIGGGLAFGSSGWWCSQNLSTCQCLFGLLCPPPPPLFPTTQSIDLVDPDPSSEATVRYQVKFNQAVSGVDVGDFKLTPSGAVIDMEMASVTPVDTSTDNRNTTYNVSVNTGTGDGKIQLDLVDNDSIRNSNNIPLGGNGAENGNFTGPAYTMKRSSTPPFVDSIKPVDPNPTKQPEVGYDVQFTQDVTGVDLTDFQLSKQPSIPDAQISRYQERSPSLYRVFVTTGSETNSGCFHLNLVDDDSIKNREGTPLGGVGAGNGNASGDLYSKIVCGALW